MSPVIPAAAFAWPMFPLTEPIAHERGGAAAPAPSAAYASASARSSMPSPTSVPVAWHSTYEIELADTPAIRSADTTAARCPATPGAAYPALRAPSLVTPSPRIRAYTESSSRAASSARFSTTAPTASPKTVPCAFASNGRTRPSIEKTSPSSYR